ncbi:hypothetical protein HHX47_DHR4000661 [Lentinula edodes]|nr:hypothetical protein HHX47_DHR4000661 [Lentinula edodes]
MSFIQQETLSTTINNNQLPLKHWTKEEVIALAHLPIVYGNQLVHDPVLESHGLVYHQTFHSVLCTVHHCVLKKSHVLRHLKNKHPNGVPKLKELQAKLDNFDISERLPTITTIPSPQFEGLPIYCGYQCPFCDVITTARKSLEAHARDHPDDHSPIPASVAVQHVPVQRFGHTHSAPFVITPLALKPPSPIDSIIETLATKLKHTYTMPSTVGVGEYTLNTRLITPWLLKTKWPLIIGSHSIPQLRTLSSQATADDDLLTKASSVIHSLTAQAVVMIDLIPELILQKLNTPEPSKGLSHLPFKKHAQDQVTMRTYTAELTRLVCLLLRADEGVYPFNFPPTVQSSIEAFRQGLNNADCTEETLILSARDMLFTIWSYKWPQNNSTKVTSDPTLLWLSFRMLLSHGGFRDPVQTTPVIARLEYNMRLVGVLILGDAIMAGLDVEQVWETIAPCFSEEEPFTFHSLRQIQHYATSLVHNQISLPRIIWSDHRFYRTMIYLGDQIHFSKLLGLFRYLEAECVTIWKDQLMLGTGLSIDWYNHHLADNLTNKDPGYSLFSDPRNTSCFGDCTQLLRAILCSSELCQKFITGIDHTTNLPIWNHLELRKWLLNYSAFHTFMVMRWEMLGGSPIRGTELVSMLFQNTQTRQRNLVVLSSYLTIVAMYHKAGALTQSDKLLPHASDALTADLTIQDLGLARPFAQFAALECFPQSTMVHEAYRDLLFVQIGRPFEADEISEAMGKVTLQTIGVHLGMNAYRHVSIAFRRMLVDKATEAEAQAAVMRQIEAEQASHTEKVEHSRYAVSLDAIGGQSDQVLSLFCEASVRWQIKCKVVPGHIHKPYSQVDSAHFHQLKAAKVFQLVDIPDIPDDDDDDNDNDDNDDNHDDDHHHLENDHLVHSVVDKLKPVLEEVVNRAVANLEHSLLSKLGSVGTLTSSHVLDQQSVHSSFASSKHSLQANPAASNVGNGRPIKKQRQLVSFSLAAQEKEEEEKGEKKKQTNYNWPNSSTDDDDDDDDYIPSSESSPGTSTFASSATLTNNSTVQRHSPTNRVTLGSDGHLFRFPNVSADTEAAALSILGQLLHIASPTWTCDEQRAGIMGAIDGSYDMIVIARTGSGKTMIPIIASLAAPHKIIIVAIPLRSLIHDYQRRLAQWQVPYQLVTSDSSEILPHSSLVLVSADFAVHPSFRASVKHAHQSKPVGAFVFDEGQLVVTDSDFRDKLRNAMEIRCVNAPVIVATGTAPPIAVPIIAERFGLVEPYLVVRGPTDRPEIKLVIEEQRSMGAITQRTLELVQKYISTFATKDRALIFVQNIQYGKDLAKALTCELYSGSQQDTPDRLGTYTRWIEGNNIVMVATSAFYAGNDYPHIRLAIFAGTPGDMTGTIQGATRIARDHQLGTCILLPQKNAKGHLTKVGEVDYAGAKSILQLCNNSPKHSVQRQHQSNSWYSHLHQLNFFLTILHPERACPFP